MNDTPFSQQLRTIPSLRRLIVVRSSRVIDGHEHSKGAASFQGPMPCLACILCSARAALPPAFAFRPQGLAPGPPSLFCVLCRCVLHRRKQHRVDMKSAQHGILRLLAQSTMQKLLFLVAHNKAACSVYNAEAADLVDRHGRCGRTWDGGAANCVTPHG